MEESSNEAEVNQSFHSPPRRRRSTFFERRESFVPQAVEKTDENACTTTTAVDDKHNQKLMRYEEKLLEEKQQWKKEVNDRRHKYHDLRQQYQMAAKAPARSRISYSALTNEDIEFLKAKTNLSKLVDSQMKLHKSVKETRALIRRANQLDDVILNYCEQKVRQISEYIYEHSTVEFMETSSV